MSAEDLDLLFEDVLSVLRAEVGDLGDTSNPPTPTPSGPASCPIVPAGQNTAIHPQPVQHLAGGQYDGRSPLGAAPLIAAPGPNVVQAAPVQQPQAVMQPAHLHSQAGARSQGQNLPYVHLVPSAAVAIFPAALPQTCNNVPVARLPGGVMQNLHPVEVINGATLREIPAGFTIIPAACPPPNTSMSKKRKRDDQQDDRPYIKKPPNAFMLFMKEQRPNFAAEMSMSGSAAVHTILGQRWRALSKEEQAKYFVEANKERLLHEQRYPCWSSLDNYGKKRKRDRSKAAKMAEASTSEEVTQQAKRQRVTLVETSVMEPSSSQTGVIEGHQRQTVLVQQPHTQAPMTVHVTDTNTPSEACTAMVSPAAPMETQTTESHYLAVPDLDSLWEEVFEHLPLRPQPQPCPLPQRQPQSQQRQHQPEPELQPELQPEPQSQPPCGLHFILAEIERLNSVLEEQLEPPPLRQQPQPPSGTQKAESNHVADFDGLNALLAEV